MVLMAIVNANYEFIIAEFGTNGRISDGGVIECTEFFKRLKNNTLGIPDPECVNNSDKLLNYVFVADEAFSLLPNLLKPFNRRDLTDERKIFNYRLSRARRIVENAFGILVSRFRIFHTSINLRLDNIDIVVMASCALHNFLRNKFSDTYTPSGTLDYEDTIQGTMSFGLRSNDSNLVGIEKGRYKSISNDGKNIRLQFLDYFNNEGALPWQKKSCNIDNICV